MANQKNKGGAPIPRGQSKKDQQRYLDGHVKVSPKTFIKVTYNKNQLLEWLQNVDCEEISVCMAGTEDNLPKVVIDQEKIAGFSKDSGEDDSFNFGCFDPPGCD